MLACQFAFSKERFDEWGVKGKKAWSLQQIINPTTFRVESSVGGTSALYFWAVETTEQTVIKHSVSKAIPVNCLEYVEGIKITCFNHFVMVHDLTAKKV